MVSFSEEFERAPSCPTAPMTVLLLSEAQGRAVAYALKATGLFPTPMIAVAAADIVVSELRHLGYEVVPRIYPACKHRPNTKVTQVTPCPGCESEVAARRRGPATGVAADPLPG